MGSLTSALLTASSAMDVLENAMGVIQNNVVNASTPGYVTQTMTLNSRSFDPSQNVFGGVETGAVVSSRNAFAEENVWNQNTFLGSATQQSTSLSALQNIFSISGQSGISSALSSLYSAFSAWSNSPNDSTSRQQVLSAAQGVAQAFSQAAQSAGQLQQQTDTQLGSTVSQIDQLTTQIAGYNGQIRAGGTDDAGLQTQLYNTLETLSGLTNIQVQTQSDGTVSVLLDGQTPLVMGTTATALQVTQSPSANPTYPGATPDMQIVTPTGTDVTEQATGGQLGGLLAFRNTTLTSVLGDNSQQGSLNQLAQAFADTVNQLLESGQTSSGSTGIALFTYQSGSPTSVAATLSVNSSITASQLAAEDPGPPVVANGIASQLAGLSSSTNAADQVNGMSYTDFYGSIATQIGNAASDADTSQTTQSSLLSQAQNMRAQVSGVSLNDQAARLTQLQQSYEAAASMITIINNTTQYLMTSFQNA
jgi:flagellar hook-associated protein 1 FlgK